jgi:hypothetical protein
VAAAVVLVDVVEVVGADVVDEVEVVGVEVVDVVELVGADVVGTILVARVVVVVLSTPRRPYAPKPVVRIAAAPTAASPTITPTATARRFRRRPVGSTGTMMSGCCSGTMRVCESLRRY